MYSHTIDLDDLEYDKFCSTRYLKINNQNLIWCNKFSEGDEESAMEVDETAQKEANEEADTNTAEEIPMDLSSTA